jgi:transglutaminase-like putative cysteine protease
VRAGARRDREAVLPGRTRDPVERLMTWRLAIDHVTTYEYEGDVLTSYNEARISPARDASQTILNHRVEVSPNVSVMRYVDCWGTAVSAFDVHEPHRRLVIAGRSLVETVAPSPDSTDIEWEAVHDENLRDRFYEFLASSPSVPLDEPFRDVARVLAEARSPRETVGAVSAWVRENLVYETGATDVSTNARTALELGRGVCQDFVHVALALLRSVGIPARYSSGYLHPDADAELNAAVTGQSHAWLEAWTGSWQRVDPTNGDDVGERHVFVARGRDYGDVTPLKGVYNGPPAHSSDATVTIRRVA